MPFFRSNKEKKYIKTNGEEKSINTNEKIEEKFGKKINLEIQIIGEK